MNRKDKTNMNKSIELKEGVDVFAADGKQVGKVTCLVLDPATDEVTHIVVQKRGGILPDDRVVPLEILSSATGEKIVLSEQVGDFNELPFFEERHYIQLKEDDLTPAERQADKKPPSYYWYPPQGYIGYPPSDLEYYPWLPIETTRNIPEDTVPLKEGADVMTSDGEHVGHIERLIVESDSNRTTHFVITQGLFFKDRRLIPAQWVKSIEEDKVYLLISSQLVERLPAYEPQGTPDAPRK